jgi:hypothetical protein
MLPPHQTLKDSEPAQMCSCLSHINPFHGQYIVEINDAVAHYCFASQPQIGTDAMYEIPARTPRLGRSFNP